MSSTPKSTAATTTLSGLGMIGKGFRAAEHTAMATHTSITTAFAHASESTVTSILSVVPQTLLSDTVAAYIVVYSKVAPVDYSAIHWALGLAITAGAGATLARLARKTTPLPADLKPKRWRSIARWLNKKLRTDAKLRKEVHSAKRLIEEKNDNLQTRGAPTDDAGDVEDVEESPQFGALLQAYDNTSADDDSDVGETELKRVRSENATLREQLQKQEEAYTNDQQMLDQLRREKEVAQTSEAELLQEIQQSRDLDAAQTEDIAENNKEREDLQKQIDDKTKQLNEETKRRQRAERKLKELQGSNSRPAFFSRMANLVSTPRSKPSSANGSPHINASPPGMSSPLANRDKPAEHGSSPPHVPSASPPPATEEHASNSGVSPIKNLPTNQAVSTPQDTSTPSSSHQTTDKASVKSHFKDEITPEDFNARMKRVDLPPLLAKRSRDASNDIKTPRPAKRLETDQARRCSGGISPGSYRQVQKASLLTPSGGPAIKLRMPGRQQASVQPTEAPEGSNVGGNEEDKRDVVDTQTATSAPGPSNAALDDVTEEDEVMTDDEIQAAIEEVTRPSPSPVQQAPANDDVDMAEPEQPTMQPPQPTPAPEAAPSDAEMLDNDAAPATSKRAHRESLIPIAPATVRKSSRLASKAPISLNERDLATEDRQRRSTIGFKAQGISSTSVVKASGYRKGAGCAGCAG